MKLLINFILILAAVILQISVIPRLELWAGIPNLLLVIVLALVFVGRSQEASWWAGIGGILLDLNSPAPFGLYTISFLILYFTFYFLTTRLFSRPPILLAAVFFLLSSLALDLPFLVIRRDFSPIIPDFIYNMLLGCLVYWLVRTYFKPQTTIR